MSTTLTKPTITYDQFGELSGQLDIRIGQIVDAERVPKSFGLKLTVSFGPSGETKTAFTNLGKDNEPEALIGLLAPFLLNMEPSEIKGVMSEVMILAKPNADNTFSMGTTIL
jgi:tRNA-binding EMAP/Myf-like protein